MRKFADYEYKVNGHVLRVERYGDGWTYRIFWADRTMEALHDFGDYCMLKRDAKASGIARINQEGATL